jgi:signal transduction histidine kinase
MEWVLAISVLINFIAIGYWFADKVQWRQMRMQLKKVNAQESQSYVKVSRYNRSHDHIAKEINQLIERVNQLSVRFERIMNENKQMVSSISHDFRTPLTSMLGYIQMLRKEAYTANEEKYLSIIEERTRTLSQLVEEFYTLSTLESNEYKLTLQKINPYLLIQEQLASYYEELEKAYETVDVTIPEEALFIQTSPNDLKRIVGNLLKNAFQHGQSSFKVSAQKNGGEVLFIFENEVANPENLDVDRLFDRMYRGDKSRSNNSTGLGLSIAQKLAERLRMQLDASLEENVLRFTLHIPVEVWKTRNSHLPKK